MNELDIFATAIELATPEERDRYLAETCGTDATLRERIEVLLQSSDKAGSFLETPPSAVATSVEELRAAAPERPSLAFLRPSDKPGSLGRLDHYDILEVVGTGGMGIVLKARDEKLQRIVAIKMMAEALAASPIARRRFVGEAQAAAAIRDDHVVSIYAVEDAGPVPYLVMELISGVSLQQRLEQTGPLEMREICRIGMQIACGLTAAHAQGVIHRDIKPANILLENGVGRVKITDFGLARVAGDASASQSGLIAGTPQYMSPEQARGKIIDPRSDLFSLGSTLYAMCTGRAPFRASSAMAVLKRVCEDRASPIHEANPDIPQWLVDLVDNLHAKASAERIQSAGEVAEQLRQYLAGRLDRAELPATSTPPLARDKRPRWALAAAAAVFLCLVGALSLTEATGVTQVVPTVIRIVTGDGTLVVVTDDPAVKVTVEGDGGLMINGAGLEEIRLRPGSYRVHADKDGRPLPLDKELVTVAHGGRAIVQVKLESAPAMAAAKAEKGAFVLLGGKGVAERKFDTLAEAVLTATEGDVIEIRGNGPFVTEPIQLDTQLLTIRAGAGFRPVIRLSPNSTQGNEPLLLTKAVLTLEGLEMQRLGQKAVQNQWPHPSLVSTEGQLRAANCRFVVTGTPWQTCVWSLSRCVTLTNCDFICPGSYGVFSFTPTGRQLILDNCVFFGDSMDEHLYKGPPPEGADVFIKRCTVVSSHNDGPITVAYLRAPDGDASVVKKVCVEAAGNVFVTPTAMRFWQSSEYLAKSKRLGLGELEELLPRLFSWRDRGNVYGADAASIVWDAPEIMIGTTLGKPADWKKYWGDVDGDLSEGSIRLQGGNLAARATTEAEKIAPEDFRLRPDSAGYRAGPDGKDLGANVDLVGPGEAYERWQKTPEYQVWLKETGQLKAKTPAPEPKAFVLLGVEGVPERKFDTLAEAVLTATDGDIIEIRGNGPFTSEPINIKKTALTIRAAPGFRPVIRLNAERETGPYFLQSDGPLVLEGLELHREAQDSQVAPWRGIIYSLNASLCAANCRFRLKGLHTCIQANSAILELRNCEFLCTEGSAVTGDCTEGQRWGIENCVLAGGACGLSDASADLNEVHIRLVRNTMVRAVGTYLSIRREASLLQDSSRTEPPLRIEASGNVFDASASHLILDQFVVRPLPASEAKAALRRLLDWQGLGNLYASDQAFLTLSAQWKSLEPPATSVRGLADWKEFWGGAEVDSLEGRIRYQGGDLLAKLPATPEKLTPDDFRLRADSDGYRAGKDGKDLGADVDLVGPGKAYERWKKTPEYQEWLKETGQFKAKLPAPEPKAFVLVGGEGVPERNFDTLAQAVRTATDSDIIEIRGNGPFVMQPIEIHQALAIRAGDGFWPVIRMEPGAPGDDYLLTAHAPLVLEGLEIRELSRKRSQKPATVARSVIYSKESLHLANCRLLQEVPIQEEVTLILAHSKIVLRNCQFRSPYSNFASFGNDAPVWFEMDNCLGLGGSAAFLHYAHISNQARLEFRRNTLVTFLVANMGFSVAPDSPFDIAKEKRIQFEASANVFDLQLGMFEFGTPLEPLRANMAWQKADDADAAVTSLVGWREKRNVYSSSATAIHWGRRHGENLPLAPANLGDWQRRWKLSDTGSFEGHVRCYGGDLLVKAAAAPETITPEDFRLRPDSAGYRAGPDGKDLGADVDLVGPGAAYKRWTKTPEYQEWLKETGRVSSP